MPKLVTTIWMCDRCMRTYESDEAACSVPQVPPRWSRLGEAYFCSEHRLTLEPPPPDATSVQVRTAPPIIYLVDREHDEVVVPISRAFEQSH